MIETQQPPARDQQSEDGVSATTFEQAVCRQIRYALGKECERLSERDLYQAVARTVRDRMMDRMLDTERRYRDAHAKRLYYLSLEFLIGRSLENNLSNLGLLDLCRESLRSLGGDLEAVFDQEPDAALGNGGLGRLAACFLDSLATLNMPGYGYGINYEFGLFRQEIFHGAQSEKPDSWMVQGTPWQIERPEFSCLIPVYGRVEHTQDRLGRYNPMWLDWKEIRGVPHDMLIVGYGGRTVNTLRLFSARASREFDMQIFNDGDYHKAVRQKMDTETISKVLYPSDIAAAGRELRLVQEYFLVACAIRDIMRQYLRDHDNFDAFPSQVAIQLNDTHPALTVAELMRTFVDENDLTWERAWEITQATLGYTNHTLLSEALERWPVPLFEYVLPRHLQIIYEINRRFLEQVAAVWPGDEARLNRMSLIEEGPQQQIRMANLSIVGSHSVNGVSALHTELVKTSLVPDFYQLWPEKFNNKTNGVTQRRWLLQANPGLAGLISRTIGDRWIADLDQLRALEPHAADAAFGEEFLRIKRANKERLARLIEGTTGLRVSPATLFDVQVKRIHEYKRQLLNVMHIIHEYLSLVEDGQPPRVPRTYIFAGKAAPGYWAAKQMIKLIHSVGRVVNNDSRVGDHLRVVFMPDYRVSLAEQIIPAADLSEQISTAGKEASGTGNMKFAMNGALTMGTLDGANVEIREEVGPDNIFIFGLTADAIQDMQRRHAYHPADLCQANPTLQRVMDSLRSNRFCVHEPHSFRWIYDALMGHDEYFHVADLPSYIDAQREAADLFTRPAEWAPKAVLNVARSGKFSSDRTIREYASDIWNIQSY